MRTLHAPLFAASLCVASTLHAHATPIMTTPPAPTARALDGLVAGVALYPDSLLQTILVAAETPVALHRAAESLAGEEAATQRPGGRFASRFAQRIPAVTDSPAVEELRKNPDVLLALDEHLMVTARLGAAHRDDPDAVWQAIARVRAQIDQGAALDHVNTQGSAPTPLWIIAANISDGLAPAEVVAEIEGVRIDADVSLSNTTGVPPTAVVWNTNPSNNIDVTVNQGGGTTTVETHNGSVTLNGGGTTTVQTHNGSATLSSGGGSTSVQTPYGTVNGSGGAVGGTVKVGDTTYAGVAGGGTVTGPNGTTVNGAGYAKGSVTQTDDGSNWNSSAGGAVTSSNGGYAAGTREGSGSAKVNNDGSVDVDRKSSGQVQSSQGNASFEHEGSATVTGDGNGSYEGSTTVKTDQGNVSTNTSAGNGKFSTSVDSPNGATTYGNGKSSSPSTSGTPNTAAASSRMNSTSTPSGSRFGATTPSNPTSRYAGSSPTTARFGDPAATPSRSAPPTSSSKYQGMSRQQIDQANQSLNQSWGSLEKKMSPSASSGRSSPPSRGGSMSKQPPKPPQPSKPSRGGRGGRGR